MLRIILVLMVVLSLATQQVAAFSLIDDNTRKIVTETWDAQSVEQLENGVVSVPASAVNDYIQSVLPDYPAVKEARVTIHAGNVIALDLNTKQTGRVFLEGTITRFVQNKDESSVSIMLTKHKLLDRPMVSWFFSNMSVGMLTKLFGNPLKGNEDNYTAKFDGNLLTINFRPYVERSPINSVAIMDTPLSSLVTVDSLTTAEDMIYLHSSFAGSKSIFAVIRRLLPGPQG